LSANANDFSTITFLVFTTKVYQSFSSILFNSLASGRQFTMFFPKIQCVSVICTFSHFQICTLFIASLARLCHLKFQILFVQFPAAIRF
jgi:hypothetical protein